LPVVPYLLIFGSFEDVIIARWAQ